MKPSGKIIIACDACIFVSHYLAASFALKGSLCKKYGMDKDIWVLLGANTLFLLSNGTARSFPCKKKPLGNAQTPMCL